MRNARVNRPFPTRLWLSTVLAILAIVAVGIIVNRFLGNAATSIAARLAAAAIVTAFVAVAKVVAGPRAAAVTGVVGTAIAVALLVALA